MVGSYGGCLRKLLRGGGERVRRCGCDALRDASGAHLVSHDGRRCRIRGAICLEMRIGRRLARRLLGHARLLKARKGRLLGCFGARSREHAWRLARRLAHDIFPRARALRRNDLVGLIHGVRERGRCIAHGAVGHAHLLGVRELRIELGRVAHERGRVHHGTGDCGWVVNVRKAVAIVVRDSGLVDPGAHVDRRAGASVAMAEPIR